MRLFCIPVLVLPLVAGLLAATIAVPAHAVALKVRAATSVNLGDASEIPAYDASGDRIFVVGIDGGASFVKIVDARTGAEIGTLDTGATFPGSGANSPGYLFGGQLGVRFPLAFGVSLDVAMEYSQFQVNFQGANGIAQQWVMTTGIRF